MLQSIRQYAGSFVVKILFVVLILSFFVWGIADVFRPSQGDDWAAKVGDRTIDRDAFEREYQAAARRLQSQVGGSLDPEQMRRLGLGRNVAAQMINRTLIEEAAADLGIAAPDEVAKRVIMEDRRFRNAEGRFDPQILERFLRQVGLSEQGYLAEVRDEIDLATLLGGLTSGVVLPRPLDEALRAYLAERRTVDYVRIAFDAEKVGEPDEAALEAYFTAHQDSYRTPERRAVEILVVDPASVAGQIRISDDEIRTAYEERQDEFVTPERRSFRQVLFDDEAKARAAGERLAAGAGLDAVAGDAPPAAIGPVTAVQLPMGLREAVFAAGKGPLPQPIRSSLGWHLVEVTAIEPETAVPLAEATARLRQTLTEEKAADLVIDIGNRIEDGLGRGQPLDEIARSVGLAPRSLPAVTEGGLDAADKPIPDLPPKAAETAFATAKGATSELIEAGRDQYLLVKVVDVTPAAPRPFAEVRADVRAAWLAEKRREAATATAAKVAERAGAGASLADAGREFGLQAAHAGPFGRGDGQGDAGGALPPELVRRALEGPAGALVSLPTEDAIFVFRSAPATAAAPAAAVADGELRALKAALRDDILAQYLAALRTRHPVTVNDKVVAGAPAGG